MSSAILREVFGRTKDGATVDRYTLSNRNGVTIQIITYGATVTSVVVPDVRGEPADVVLGYDRLADYVLDSSCLGAVIGRYANRIARGRFSLEGSTYRLAVNNGPNHIHGGLLGFNKVIWQVPDTAGPQSSQLELLYESVDGEEGYPGNLRCTVRYSLTDENQLKIDYEAETDKPTPVNLSNHSYFNLEGHGAGDVLAHQLELRAERYAPADETLIPTGELLPVEGTPMDFRTPTAIGARIHESHPQLRYGSGYDQNWVIDRESGDPSPVLAASVFEPKTGRAMEVWTTQPGVQLYTGNHLQGVPGKGGAVYNEHAGFCLETQHFPDSPNQPDFPSAILRPGERYHQQTIFQFFA